MLSPLRLFSLFLLLPTLAQAGLVRGELALTRTEDFKVVAAALTGEAAEAVQAFLSASTGSPIQCFKEAAGTVCRFAVAAGGIIPLRASLKLAATPQRRSVISLLVDPARADLLVVRVIRGEAAPWLHELAELGKVSGMTTSSQASQKAVTGNYSCEASLTYPDYCDEGPFRRIVSCSFRLRADGGVSLN